MMAGLALMISNGAQGSLMACQRYAASDVLYLRQKRSICAAR